VRVKVIAPPPIEHREPQEPVSITTKPAPTPPVAVEPVPDSAATALPSVAPPVASPSTDRFAVQAGAFADRDRAESLRATLEDRFTQARIVSNGGASGAPLLWRVIVGREMTREQATALAVRVRQETGAALVVAEPEPALPPAPQ